jgi:hypothetical protein
VESQYMKVQKELLADAKERLYKSTNQLADFLQCIESRQKPICHESVGGTTAIACHLLNIAYRTGKSFGWNPKDHSFADESMAASELTREYRGVNKV